MQKLILFLFFAALVCLLHSSVQLLSSDSGFSQNNNTPTVNYSCSVQLLIYCILVYMASLPTMNYNYIPSHYVSLHICTNMKRSPVIEFYST
jgi:hypothetical protein